MPAEQLTKADLHKRTGTKQLRDVLKTLRTEGYKGKTAPVGVPAGVSGTCKLSSVRCSESENGWINVSPVLVCLTPTEHEGKQVYPAYLCHKDDFKDEEKAMKSAKQMFDFLAGLGISEEDADALYDAGESEFLSKAVELINNAKGNVVDFSSRLRKKKKATDEDRTDYRCRGLSDKDTTAPFEGGTTPTENQAWHPQVDDVIRFLGDTVDNLNTGDECLVLESDPTTETLTLKPPKGPAVKNVSWFNGDEPQIDFVRSSN